MLNFVGTEAIHKSNWQHKDRFFLKKAQEGIKNVVRFVTKTKFLWKDLIGFALWTELNMHR